MSGWQIAFGSGIGATAVLIFLATVAGEIAIIGDLLDRFERGQEKQLLEGRDAAAQEAAD